MRVARALHHVLDFCYPATCRCCDDPAPAGEFLCASCGGHLAILASATSCERCAMPLAMDGAPCPYCLGKGVAPFERIIRLGIFDDPIKQLIHRFKYQRQWHVGEFLADCLLQTERVKTLLTETDVLVPVPLHFRRHIGRGFNQADVIARRLKRHTNISVVPAVRRTRHTETQTNIHSSEKRFANVRGAFALCRSAEKLRDKHVVLVDDVLTTAATLKAAGNILKQARPTSLCAITIAIADPKRRGFEAI